MKTNSRFRNLYITSVGLLLGFFLFSSSITAKTTKHLLRDAKSTHGMVVSAHPLASQIGVDILKSGGNAVDAAVAVGFSLGVLEPNASGLGGGGFLIVRMAKTGQTAFFDFREKAPGNATEDFFKLDSKGKQILDKRGLNPSAIGGKSIAVPGETAGLLAVLEKYGTMSREKVMIPAIQLASKGVAVSEKLGSLLMEHFEMLDLFPETAAIYLEDGFPKEAGDIIRNPDLAKTLRLIAKKGKDGFYKGEVAKSIVNAVHADGGVMTLNDLADYSVSVRGVLKGHYRGFEIITVPPSSSGGAHLIELLNIMENFDLKKMGLNSADYIHAWSEAMKLVYADRAKFMGDIDFVNIPLEALISKVYATKQFKRINMTLSNLQVEPGDPWAEESGSTTHFSVVDSEQNLVACTKTINHFFGSGITAPGTGVLLNDEMDDFSKNPGEPNSIAANKRPLSSMSPTIIFKDGKPFASLGTPGGKRIITTLALIISSLIDFEMDIQSAIEAPKFNQYQNGDLKMESRIPTIIQSALEKKGHVLSIRKPFDLYFGGAQGITINHKTGEYHGGADPRRDGIARGY